MVNLKNKIALVIGGGSWIGKAISKTFASSGATVIIAGRDLKKLKETESKILQNDGKAHAIKADITDPAKLKVVFDKIKKQFKQLDIVVQNAAIYPANSIEDMSLNEWQKVIDVNLTGSFLVLKYALPLMKSLPHGRYILISSIAGDPLGLSGFSHYCASKSGLNGLMRAAAIEFAKYNITVNCISPGNILHVEEVKINKQEVDKMLRAIPLGRLGKPNDIANLALHLASDEACFITGQNYIVDGGETIMA